MNAEEETPLSLEPEQDPTFITRVKEHFLYLEQRPFLLLGVGFILVLLSSVIWYLFSSISESDIQNAEDPTRVQLGGMSYSSYGLYDSGTVMYFADSNILYKGLLDGSPPQKIHAFPRTISRIDQLPDKRLLIDIQLGSDATGNEINEHTYLLSANSTEPQPIDIFLYQSLKALVNHTRLEAIYTKELPNGTAEVFTDFFDGNPPVIRGQIQKKIIPESTCVVNEPCTQFKHPSEFLPSPNGSFLLSKPPGIGNATEQAFMYSADFTRQFPTDFDWGEGTAIWLSDSAILFRNSDSTLQQYVYEHEAFQPIPTTFTFEDTLTQDRLSPDGKTLVLTKGQQDLFLIDLDTGRIVSLLPDVERTDLQMQFVFIGWNHDGSKLLFAQKGQDSGSTEVSIQGEIAIKLYDLIQHKTFLVATLYQDIVIPTDKSADKGIIPFVIQ